MIAGKLTRRPLLVIILLCMASLYDALAADLYSVRKLNSNKANSALGYAINNAGEVAGGAGVAHSPSAVGVVWSVRGTRDIKAPGRGGDFARAAGINNKQQVVGSANTESAVRAFQWTPQGGLRLLLTLPGDNSSEAHAINEAGIIAGYSGGKSGLRAVLWTASGIRNLGVLPGGDHSEAVALNAGGDAAGFSNSSSGSHAIFWRGDGEMRDLGTLPGDTTSWAAAVNDAQQVVGSSQSDSGSHAFLWSESAGMQNLGTLPGGEFSAANAINNSSVVVGRSDSSLGQRAFLWTAADGMRDLNILIPPKSKVILVDAVAINEAGQILALGSVGHDLEHDRKKELDADAAHAGAMQVFLLTPKR